MRRRCSTRASRNCLVACTEQIFGNSDRPHKINRGLPVPPSKDGGFSLRRISRLFARELTGCERPSAPPSPPQGQSRATRAPVARWEAAIRSRLRGPTRRTRPPLGRRAGGGAEELSGRAGRRRQACAAGAHGPGGVRDGRTGSAHPGGLSGLFAEPGTTRAEAEGREIPATPAAAPAAASSSGSVAERSPRPRPAGRCHARTAPHGDHPPALRRSIAVPRRPGRPQAERYGEGTRRVLSRVLQARHRLPLPRGRSLLDPSRSANGLSRTSRQLAARELPHATARQCRQAGAGCLHAADAGRSRRPDAAAPGPSLPRRKPRTCAVPRGAGHPAREGRQARHRAAAPISDRACAIRLGRRSGHCRKSIDPPATSLAPPDQAAGR